MKSLSVTIQMKATEQYFPVVLFITFYKVVLSSESAYEILKSDYLKMSHNSCLYRCLFLFVSFCFVFFTFGLVCIRK